MTFFLTMALPAHSGPRPPIQFRNHFFTDGRTPWTSDQPVARPLPKHRINAYTHQTSMPWVGFEPTIPVFERAKTVHIKWLPPQNSHLYIKTVQLNVDFEWPLLLFCILQPMSSETHVFRLSTSESYESSLTVTLVTSPLHKSVRWP
jgi:hypothetical protein